MRRSSLSRRTMLGVAALATAAPLLSACRQAPAQQRTGAPEQPPEIKPATVKYIHVDTGEPVWQDVWTKIFDGFQAKYPQVKLEVDPVPTIAASNEKAT